MPKKRKRDQCPQETSWRKGKKKREWMNEGVTGGRQITAYLDTTNKPPPTSSTRRWHARVCCSVAVNPHRSRCAKRRINHESIWKVAPYHCFRFSLWESFFTFISDSFGEKAKPEAFIFRLKDPFSVRVLEGYYDIILLRLYCNSIPHCKVDSYAKHCREFCVLSRIFGISGSP